MKRFVVAISGPSGAGKTTVVKALSVELEAASLFFDDWTDDPPGIEEWIGEPDADYSRWTTPELALGLSALKSGVAVTVPTLSPSVGQDRTAIVEPAPIIVIEEPYGRLRADVAPLLDLVVCIDLPPQIALARRLTRQVRTAQGWAENATDDAGRLAVLSSNAQMVRGFLDAYLDFGHRAYAYQRDRLLESCDLVVNGLGSVDEIVDEVADAVRSTTGTLA